ncbi:MAG TPA: HAD family phosphatase [Nocardioidaceae bacterium]|nr:HAD family phosphatase [Nocardioidaceae bacterium]
MDKLDKHALIVDWGGVLTERLDLAMRAWAEQEGLDFDAYLMAMRSWLDPAQQHQARVNPVHALERGEIERSDFEVQLAERITEHSGRAVDATGLLERMFDCFEHAPAMNSLVLRAHEAGVRTALLSNSWGNTYPRDGWDEMFDVVVISGEVGARKPDRAIFDLVCGKLGVAPADSVFVDDMAPNIDAAQALGMTTVLHTGYDETAARLSELFGLPLA